MDVSKGIPAEDISNVVTIALSMHYYMGKVRYCLGLISKQDQESDNPWTYIKPDHNQACISFKCLTSKETKENGRDLCVPIRLLLPLFDYSSRVFCFSVWKIGRSLRAEIPLSVIRKTSNCCPCAFLCCVCLMRRPVNRY